LAGAYFLFPPAHVVLWAIIGASSAAAIVVGVHRHQPAKRLAWYLLAAGVLTFTAGDTVYNVLTSLMGYDNPFPSLADAFYLGVYVFSITGLTLLVRARTVGRDTQGLLDALAIATGIALLSWIFLIVPYVRDASLTVPQRLVAISYPLGDIVLLWAIVRLWISGGHHPIAYRLLGLAFTSVIVGDTFYAMIQLFGTWEIGGPVDFAYVVFYLSIGAAALHPSMRQVTEPVIAEVRLTRRRLALLTGASLMAPAMLVLQWLRGAQLDVPVFATACTALFGISLTRMFGLAKQVTTQNERKRLLARVLEATEEERTRIASDLHDGPVQALAVLSYNAHRARRKLSQEDHQAADALMRTVETSLEQEVKVLRRLMSDLRPPVLDNRGLAAALSDHVTNFERDNQIVSTLELDFDSRLIPELETVLYRVVQESLNNIAKHAQAQHVRVSVMAENATIHARVQDDGVGFQMFKELDLLKGGHYGLTGMRERVELAGGRLAVVSAVGQGTTIDVTLPMASVEGDQSPDLPAGSADGGLSVPEQPDRAGVI
jgi:signal transduction histidine kinase